MARIRAKVKKGKLELLRPLPKSWKDGVEVELNGGPVPSARDLAQIDADFAELDRLAKQLDNPEDWKRMEEALAEHDRMAKEWMRREMGLDS
jgi:hypothetical protein